MNVFGIGFKNLFNSISKLKETLRTGRETEQKRRNAEDSIAKSALTHSARNKLSELYSDNYGRFYNYALREIRFRSYQGYTKPGIIGVNDVLDEALLSVAKKITGGYNEAKARRLFYHGIKKAIDDQLNPSGIGLIPIEDPIEPESIDAAYQEYYQPDEIIKVEDILIDPDTITAERQVEYLEIEMLIDKLLAQLPADWRDIFILHVREDLPISSIAQNKGKSVGEIRTILRNAKKFIHEKLIDAGFRWKE
jgi:RNA polymerase sigma factor (sigma-70 family)